MIIMQVKKTRNEMSSNSKKGRPFAEVKKTEQIRIRVDAERKEFYSQYCTDNETNFSELIIQLLDKKTKFKKPNQ